MSDDTDALKARIAELEAALGGTGQRHSSRRERIQKTVFHLQRWAPADLRSSAIFAHCILHRDNNTRLLYRELLDSLWLNAGTLPSDAEMLRAYLVLDFEPAEIQRCLDVLRRFGKVVDNDDGTISNPRVSTELDEELAYREVQRERGARGGSARGAKRAPATKKATAKRSLSAGSAGAERALSPPAPAPAPAPAPTETPIGGHLASVSSPANGLYACKPAGQQASARAEGTDTGRRVPVVGADGQERPFEATPWTRTQQELWDRQVLAGKLANEIAEMQLRLGDEGADASAVLAKAASYLLPDGSEANTCTDPRRLSPQRLDRTIVDLRAMKKAAEQAIAERERKRAPAPPRQPRGEPVPEPEI